MKERISKLLKSIEYLNEHFIFFDKFVADITIERIIQVDNVPFIFAQYLIYKHVYLADIFDEIKLYTEMTFTSEIEVCINSIEEKKYDYRELDMFFEQYIEFRRGRCNLYTLEYLTLNPFIKDFGTESLNIN